MVDERQLEARIRVTAPIIVEFGSDRFQCQLGDVSAATSESQFVQGRHAQDCLSSVGRFGRFRTLDQ